MSGDTVVSALINNLLCAADGHDFIFPSTHEEFLGSSKVYRFRSFFCLRYIPMTNNGSTKKQEHVRSMKGIVSSSDPFSRSVGIEISHNDSGQKSPARYRLSNWYGFINT